MYGFEIVTLIGYAICAIMTDIGMIASVSMFVPFEYSAASVVCIIPFALLNVLIVYLVHEVFTD